jgi:thiamine kinase-like enzyme
VQVFENGAQRHGSDVSTPSQGAGDGAVVAVPSPELASRLAAVPLFTGREFDAVPLIGGLTNENYRVTVGGQTYVARLSSPSGALLAIDREAEYANAMAAAASGAAPAVAGYAPEAGVLVVEWVEGRTLTEADLRDVATLRRLAASCRQLHAGPRFVRDFDMFDIQRRYLAVVREYGFRLPERYLEFLPVIDRIRGALAARPEPTVPCNNDLVPANLIDDGERIWLIDYEYSGNNDPCFELGNIWSEAGLPVDALHDLVAAYSGRASRRRVARARLLGLMSKYGWTLWASIQDGVSLLDFDFRAWGAENDRRAVVEFTGPDLPRLIQEVQLPD